MNGIGMSARRPPPKSLSRRTAGKPKVAARDQSSKRARRSPGNRRTSGSVPGNQAPVLSRARLRQLARAWRAAGDKIVLTNGCFDLLHVGHARYLRAAKKLSSRARLIVAINSNASARALKGPGRPRVTENERAEVVAALRWVDAVVIFPEPDVTALIRELRPDFHAKGTDYTAAGVPERAAVAECGGKVVIVGDAKNHSTTALLKRVGSPSRPSRRSDRVWVNG